ncbi:mutant required to maintain repression 1 [Anopheles sinensis]|uniref:Mutant required to maintain repression 1 n=1 Tax=Anopheles sinensis TaxID=74873 RepID=A0A084W4L3_ANOSI|nr:mutant required to maintain repression 1 [Anopheles sinensis]
MTLRGFGGDRKNTVHPRWPRTIAIDRFSRESPCPTGEGRLDSDRNDRSGAKPKEPPGCIASRAPDRGRQRLRFLASLVVQKRFSDLRPRAIATGRKRSIKPLLPGGKWGKTVRGQLSSSLGSEMGPRAAFYFA